MTARYYIGIDLGTTNTALAYVDAQTAQGRVQIFPIQQYNEMGGVEKFSTLPSFLYLNEEKILKGLPWSSSHTIGMWAKSEGAKTPTRLIHSAKSWLLSSASLEKILPLDANPASKMSPVQVSAQFLHYLCAAWNTTIAKGHTELELAEQEIVLTVPASFDEVARNRTVEAAKLAGITRLTLLEEPQAAFYAWLCDHEKQKLPFEKGDLILICDIGGGTTDFSLIEKGEKDFKRNAVGKHLLLGGDNMDEALLYLLSNKVPQTLEFSQLLKLRHLVCKAKENLLFGKESSVKIWLGGKGSKLIGDGFSLVLTKEEVSKHLLEGFFEILPFEKACQPSLGSGMRLMGLPYEQEPSITKHLASFLKRAGVVQKPKFILFNGGVLHAKLFQERIIDCLNLWYPEQEAIQLLQSSSLDLNVGKGAAYFAKNRKVNKQIKGGIPRTYYLEIERAKEKKAVVLLPRGWEGGDQLISDHIFSALPNTPVAFKLLTSHTRLSDRAGDIVDIDEKEINLLPPLSAFLRFGKTTTEPIPVQLECHLTEIGILELWIRSCHTEHKWKLEFQVRDNGEIARSTSTSYNSDLLEKGQALLTKALTSDDSKFITNVMSALEKNFEEKKESWSPSILRALFQTLLNFSSRRNLALAYTNKFWNLAGFLLRPGQGHPLDDVKIKELWKLMLEDEAKIFHEEIQIQKAICCRRIAAGFTKGQQMRIFNDLLSRIYQKKESTFSKKGYFYAEHIRALASMELIESSLKVHLGELLIKKIVKGNGESCDYWALGRIGARSLFHGTMAHVIPASICMQWVDTLVTLPFHPQMPFLFALFAKKVDVSELNILGQTIDKISSFLQEQGSLEEWSSLMQAEYATQEMQQKILGDSLPCGLMLS